MEGYYTKKQAANMLGVSERQVSNYINDKHLRIIYQGRKAWIPKSDVYKFYTRATWYRPLNGDDIEDLQNKVTALERDIEILKLSLGFGPGTKIREAGDLLLLRQRFLDLMAQSTWTYKQISSIADELIGVHEQELMTLYTRVGPTAWLPLDHLACRMLTHLEQLPDFPSKGLEVLHTRLTRARDRFLGLVYATSHIPAKRANEAATLMGLLNDFGPIEDAILGYILAPK